ncbi:MAG: acetyl-CoA carboxylase biotin carboxyl carrier protein [Kiritimatiellales bacterium]|nr:acetyl-CoA carboxylase biotin carboxyl carrier protein [Kiritimatiellales bacterium]
MDIRNIKRIVETMTSNDLTEFSMKDKDFELTLKRSSGEPQVVYASAPAASAHHPAPAAAPAAVAATVEPEEDEDAGLLEIPSPIVGTFYRKPAPDADNFVQIGSEVNEETVVCIVEAMKVMNEIKADVNGVIAKILVDDATPVQYGQPLFLVEPK